jgi:thioredoxin 1
MENENEITLTQGQNLKELIKNSEKPVLVDFYADWCGPCLKLAPIIHDLQAKNNNKFIIVKVNIDDHQELSEEYNISGIPYVIVYKNGTKLGDFTGFDEGALKKLVDQL